MHMEELQQQGVNDVEEMMSTQFVTWFEDHVCAPSTTWLNNLRNNIFSNSLILYVFNLQITRLKYEGTTHVDEDLHSLTYQPVHRVHSYTTCTINGVQYHTMAHDEHRKTHNSSIKVQVLTVMTQLTSMGQSQTLLSWVIVRTTKGIELLSYYGVNGTILRVRDTRWKMMVTSRA
jgi:hypothetical protein